MIKEFKEKKLQELSELDFNSSWDAQMFEDFLITTISQLNREIKDDFKKELYSVVDNCKRTPDKFMDHEYIDTCDLYKFLSKIDNENKGEIRKSRLGI